MASQTAACFHEAGILLNGLPGGGAESVDLTPSARRVLHAQQMLLGTRAAGLVGPPTAPPPYPSPAPHARTQGPPDGVQQPSPYGATQRSKLRSGGAGSSGYPAEMLLALREQSDSLCTPYWSGLLGSFLLQGTRVCRSRLICSVRSAAHFSCTTVTTPLNARLTSSESAGNRRPVGRWTSWVQSSRTRPRGRARPHRRGEGPVPRLLGQSGTQGALLLEMRWRRRPAEPACQKPTSSTWCWRAPRGRARLRCAPAQATRVSSGPRRCSQPSKTSASCVAPPLSGRQPRAYPSRRLGTHRA